MKNQSNIAPLALMVALLLGMGLLGSPNTSSPHGSPAIGLLKTIEEQEKRIAALEAQREFTLNSDTKERNVGVTDILEYGLNDEVNNLKTPDYTKKSKKISTKGGPVFIGLTYNGSPGDFKARCGKVGTSAIGQVEFKRDSNIFYSARWGGLVSNETQQYHIPPSAFWTIVEFPTGEHEIEVIVSSVDKERNFSVSPFRIVAFEL